MYDYDIYIDSEEDEVFFGSFSEREEKISSNLVDNSVWNPIKQSTAQFNEDEKSISLNKNLGNSTTVEEGSDVAFGNYTKDTSKPLDLDHSKNESDLLDCEDEFHSFHSNNISVELDHNYSYTKQKIDESILATPKSVVKADKDGGYLKVLSEIALVKAEADNKLGTGKKLNETVEFSENNNRDEDKENKNCCIPEIRVTEPTPEKTPQNSPSQCTAKSFRKFKIIYHSPNSGVIDGKQKVKAKSFTENQVYIKNSGRKNWFSNGNEKNEFSKNPETGNESPKKSRGNSWPNSTTDCKNPVEIIDIYDELIIEEKNKMEQMKTEKNSNVTQPRELFKSRKKESNEIILIDLDSSSLLTSEVDKEIEPDFTPDDEAESVLLDTSTVSTIDSKHLNEFVANVKSTDVIKLESHAILKTDVVEIDDTSDKHSNFKDKMTAFTDKVVNINNVDSKNTTILPQADLKVNEIKGKLQKMQIPSSASMPISSLKSSESEEFPMRYRFSAEAKKIVEALKTSSEDDTLNFTIPEINLEEMENSFLSPEPVPDFDETVTEKKQTLATATVNIPAAKIEGMEQEPEEKSSALAENKIKLFKCLSDKKVQPTNLNDIKKCIKQLHVSSKTPMSLKGVQSCEKKLESKIPVKGTKPSKIPSSCLLSNKFGGSKITPYKRGAPDVKDNICKTHTGSAQKTSKFKNVASPISAYIHNRPTALVVNVTPQLRKGFPIVTKNSNASTLSKIIPEKTPKKTLGLPFVEYKSATPFQIEKRPESRLPRLAPTVERLIGTNSPRILKHKGRFYMRTPGRKDTTNSNATITAEPNEVSVLVSQMAQKSTGTK